MNCADKKSDTWFEAKNWKLLMMMMMMMMMMIMIMIIFFFGMFVQRKMVSLISCRDHCNRSSPSWISNTPLASSERVQNLSPGLVEWSCATVLTTTLHVNFVLWEVISEIKKLHQGLGLFFYIQLIF